MSAGVSGVVVTLIGILLYHSVIGDRDSNYFRMGDEENEDYDDMLDPSPTFR